MRLYTFFEEMKALEGSFLSLSKTSLNTSGGRRSRVCCSHIVDSTHRNEQPQLPSKFIEVKLNHRG